VLTPGELGPNPPPDPTGTRETQLHHCSSCDRLARQLAGVGATCEFCGGVLRPIWGLGQLAAGRDESAAIAPAPATLMTSVREARRDADAE